jgi:predicted DsbA family dithiol-disulfide isomerase
MHSLSEGDLESLAKNVGLDVETWRKDKASSAALETLARDARESEAAGIMSVPTMVINGRVYSGLMTEGKLLALLDKETHGRDAVVSK